jgi:hypothetical protein
MATVVVVPGRGCRVVAPHHSGLLGRKDDLSSVAEAIVVVLLLPCDDER